MNQTIRFAIQAIELLIKSYFPAATISSISQAASGLVMNEHFQIDTAANIAENNKQFSISTVYRF